MRNRLLPVFMLLLCLPFSLLAQQSLTIIPPSPDAASLGVYGNVPVSTYTGIPKVDIPLYTVECRDIKIPIDLSYHASGISVEQDASWVGLGWVLNVGGVITRTVRGGDDLQFSADGVSNLNGGQRNYRGYPYDTPVPSDPFTGQGVSDICNYNVDPEPDMFYFNFLGQSGSFILKQQQDRNLTYVEGTPLKMEKISIRYDKPNFRWEIKTPDGFTYYFKTKELTEIHHASGGGFGGTADGVVFNQTTQGFETYDDIVVSSWYLDQIISPLGEQVNYVYDVESTTWGIQSRYGSSKIALNDIKATVLQLNVFAMNGCLGLDQDATDAMYAPAAKIFTNHIYLKEIQFGTGKVVFDKSLRDDLIPPGYVTGGREYLNNQPFYASWMTLGPQKLDAVNILDRAGNTVRKFQLSYTYFNNDKTGIVGYEYRRLKLEGVRECSGNGAECKPYHTFTYHETYPLPSKYSTAQDFWGYYNGQNNPSRIPYGTFVDYNRFKIFYLGNANRQPKSEFMAMGTLKKIVYPTGGSTEFEFEPHDYFNFGDDAFGYTDFENNADPIPINYQYTNGIDNVGGYESFTFTLTDYIQDLVIDSEMTYYRNATAAESDLCNIVDPGQFYVGVEPWFVLTKDGTSTPLLYRTMSDYLDYFVSNYNANCINTPRTPERINPIYAKKHMLTLGPGTYQVKVYSRAEFKFYVGAAKNVIHPKEVKPNYLGVYAKQAGGLRIKRIRTKEEYAPEQVKRYVYTQSEGGELTSSGRLMLYPNYHIFEAFQTEYGVPGPGPGIAVCSYYVQRIKGSSWTSTPLGTSASGSIVGYDKITEMAGENGENGYTEYYYYNDVETPSENPFLIEGLPTITQTSNGLVRQVDQFTANRELLTSTSYTYQRQLSTFIYGIAQKQVKLLMPREYIPDCSLNTAVQKYSLRSDRWVPLTKVEKKYAQGIDMTTTTSYVHDTGTHLQLKSEETTAANGDVTKTEYTYPADAAWIPAAMWQDKFIHNTVVEQKNSKNGAPTTAYKGFYSLQGNTYLVNEEQSAKGSAPLETATLSTYSSKGNTKEVTRRDGVTQTYLWGYNGSYPVAQIINATYAQVLAALNLTEAQLDLLANEATPSSDYTTRIAGLRNSLPAARVTSIVYNPLIGMKSVTDPNGVAVQYEYDALGRLQAIKDHGGNILKTYYYQYKQ